MTSVQSIDATRTEGYGDLLAGARTIVRRTTRQLHQGNYWVFTTGAVAIGSLGVVDVLLTLDGTNDVSQVVFRATSALTGISDHVLQVYENPSEVGIESENRLRGTNRNRRYPSTTPSGALPAALREGQGIAEDNAAIFARDFTFKDIGSLIYSQVVPGLAIYTTEWFLGARSLQSGRYIIRLQSLTASGQTASVDIDYMFVRSSSSLRPVP